MKDAVKVIVHDADGRVLVLRRSETHPYWPLEIDFPGGDVDGNETVLQAAVRELHEETGLSGDAQQLELVESWPNHYGTTHHLYRLHMSTQQPEVMISWEHAEHLWIAHEDVTRELVPAMTDLFNRAIVRHLTAGE